MADPGAGSAIAGGRWVVLTQSSPSGIVVTAWVTVTLKVLPDEAARFMRAAETCAGGQGLIDGAVHMAELALAAPHPVDADEHATSVRPPVETVIHISAEDVGGYTVNGDGISAETSRRLLCDCGIVPMLEDAQGKTIDVGRKTHVISAALRRALEYRDDYGATGVRRMASKAR